MKYLSLNTLKTLYQVLSTNTDTPETQGATQKISAVRHLFAFYRYCVSHNTKKCDLGPKVNRDEFVKNVGDIVKLDGDNYTANFYTTIEELSDCRVGSNFFSAGTIVNSKAGTGYLLSYPLKKSLFNVNNGILEQNNDLLPNLNQYLTSSEIRAAFILWLVKSELINENALLESAQNYIEKVYSTELAQVLFEDIEDIRLHISKFNCEFNDEASMLTKGIILKMFKNAVMKIDMSAYAHQQIFFGAPGTGKSHSINEITKQMPKENVYRTTFHPDSDYSTFVGCYKPTKEKNAPIRLSYEELVEKLKEYKSTMDQSRACTMLGFQYPDSVREIDEQGKIWDLLHAVGITTGNYDTSIRCGWECYNVSKDKATSISYEFVPQTFLKAYMRAYQTTEPVVLVIEEINRGNCAQIFGDLFQLLDRKNGISEYPIKADEDLRKYLIKELGEDSPAIANGELCLPSNLYIWATMNTSDQSLFPIDAAFKRRWDWKYMKIANMEKGYKIEVEGKHYDWWQFIDKMNGIIGFATSSEDKKIGYFFCKVEEGETIITADQFVSKVLFYVYGDALKDYDIKDEAFVKEEKDGKKNYFTFSDFYDVKGDVDKVVVAQLLDKFIQADEDKENPA